MEKRNVINMLGENYNVAAGLALGITVNPINYKNIYSNESPVKLKQGWIIPKEVALKNDIEYMISGAKTHEDLDNIGAKINYAIDNGIYHLTITDLQVKASKKMKQIYNKFGEPKKQEKMTIKKSEMDKIFEGMN
jgi:hypothetical protein